MYLAYQWLSFFLRALKHPFISCCRWKHEYCSDIQQRKRKALCSHFPSFFTKCKFEHPRMAVKSPPGQEMPAKALKGSLFVRDVWPLGLTIRWMMYLLWHLGILRSWWKDCACVNIRESGGDLSGAPRVADEIKTPATGKVRAIDNWKYWHGHRGLWAGLGPDG